MVGWAGRCCNSCGVGNAWVVGRGSCCCGQHAAATKRSHTEQGCPIPSSSAGDESAPRRQATASGGAADRRRVAGGARQSPQQPKAQEQHSFPLAGRSPLEGRRHLQGGLHRSRARRHLQPGRRLQALRSSRGRRRSASRRKASRPLVALGPLARHPAGGRPLLARHLQGAAAAGGAGRCDFCTPRAFTPDSHCTSLALLHPCLPSFSSCYFTRRRGADCNCEHCRMQGRHGGVLRSVGWGAGWESSACRGLSVSHGTLQAGACGLSVRGAVQARRGAVRRALPSPRQPSGQERHAQEGSAALVGARWWALGVHHRPRAFCCGRSLLALGLGLAPAPALLAAVLEAELAALAGLPAGWGQEAGRQHYRQHGNMRGRQAVMDSPASLAFLIGWGAAARRWQR